jgi:hypothetical protein
MGNFTEEIKALDFLWDFVQDKNVNFSSSKNRYLYSVFIQKLAINCRTKLNAMKNIFYFLGFFLFFASCNNPAKNETKDLVGLNTPAVPPYTIQLEEVVVPSLPDLHSYTHGIYDDKIVLFGGRTSGLHSFGYTFLKTRSNDSIYVIDTKQWATPTSWVVYSLSPKQLKFSRQPPNKLDFTQFYANNAQFFTSTKGTLYVLGGLLGAGNNSVSPTTSPYMTAIDLPFLIASVMSKGASPLLRNSIRQTTFADTSFAITGGEISVMDNTVYQAFGWNYFVGNGTYSHQVKKFTYTDDGYRLNISSMSSWSDNLPNTRDSTSVTTAGNFRRRDGSMSAMIDPADGSNFLMYYAGVFKQGFTNFTSPVWITKDTAKEILTNGFKMFSNVYTSQVIPVYSIANKASYATLLGGMRNAQYTGGAITAPTLLTVANADTLVTDQSGFTNVPFTNQFTTISINSTHQLGQYLLPDSFPSTKVPIKLPADTTYKSIIIPPGSVMFNGAESEMHWNLNAKYLMNNGVVNYDALIKDSTNGASVGFLHGGILSYTTNALATASFHFTVASNRLFIVRIVPYKNQ